MRKLRSYTISVILLVITFLTANITLNLGSLASARLYGQEVKAVWETYTTQGEEFSVLMPELPGVIRSTKCFDMGCQAKRIDSTYAAYSNGVVYLVTSYKNEHRRQSLDEIIAEQLSQDEMSSSATVRADVKLGKFGGKRFITASKTHGHDDLMTFYLTDKRVYQLRAVGGSRNDSAIQEFFKSFALGSKKGKEIGDGARTSPVAVTEQASLKIDTQSFKVLQPGVSSAQDIAIFKPSELTRKAVIITKPSPEYTEEARKHQVSGTVTLQMLFTSSGSVTNIRTISGLEYGLTENAISAARKIYFLPAVKDGKRVTQYIRVEYNFDIY